MADIIPFPQVRGATQLPTDLQRDRVEGISVEVAERDQLVWWPLHAVYRPRPGSADISSDDTFCYLGAAPTGEQAFAIAERIALHLGVHVIDWTQGTDAKAEVPIRTAPEDAA